MHINSIDELINFLSVLKEDRHSDKKAEEYKKQLEADKEAYNIQDVSKKKESTDEAEEYEREEEVEIEKEKPTRSSKITPSLDSLIRNINDLRSGESLKRAEIRDEVGAYFDSLSSDEQQVLVLFLRELAAVVTKSKPGSEAQDPSDEPEKIIIKKSEQQAQPAPSAKPKVTKSTSTKGVEDDSAPIKVNEQQDLSEVRIRFRALQE